MAKGPGPFNNPFAKLKLETPGKAAPSPRPAAPPDSKPAPGSAEDEAELFRQSVGEVEPVRSGRGLAPPREPPSAASLRVIDAEFEALTQLSELVAGEGPFELADSQEFIQGSAPGLDARILRRLRAGAYALQGRLDLHGMTRAEARPALDKFISAARLKGNRCVLVVTGRGLHSNDQIPVLKAGVQSWLSSGRTGHQVLAFASARPEDGGAGAVYVLLRR